MCACLFFTMVMLPTIPYPGARRRSHRAFSCLIPQSVQTSNITRRERPVVHPRKRPVVHPQGVEGASEVDRAHDTEIHIARVDVGACCNDDVVPVLVVHKSFSDRPEDFKIECSVPFGKSLAWNGTVARLPVDALKRM